MDTNLLNEARASVATAISITGRQVPYDLQETARELLAEIWGVSDRYWVRPEDWAAVTALPMACLDVLVAVERRPRTERTTPR